MYRHEMSDVLLRRGNGRVTGHFSLPSGGGMEVGLTLSKTKASWSKLIGHVHLRARRVAQGKTGASGAHEA